ncbi:MAG: FAD-linked oxidase C-terminal domain-containing protein [Thermodesulfobacteriota bacterium]|nr:FAD-linked oxidase C-terminal domain-containing protein [Thermodesulfobacteriota bacterium]
MTISIHTFKDLRDIVGKAYCSNAKEDLVCYGYDATAINFLPDAIVFPQKASQVASILRLANRNHFNVIPRGSGSGMSGGSLPINGGVVIIMTRFNRIHKIDTDNLVAHVEPGVITGHFHRVVEKEGLFYPPDPASSAFCTLGGNMAECAGGPRAVKYGVTRDYVLGLEVVLPTGEIIKTGVKTAKGVVGYDLTRLFIGSEGTLGIITRMTLKLLPLPKEIRTMTAVFEVIDQAAETVSEIIRRSIIPRTIEFIDNASIQCAEDHLNIGLPVEAQAMLLIDVDGTAEEADRAVTDLKKLCISQGATRVKVAENKEEAANLWKARKAISPALFKYAPDKINEDIVVPRSKIPQMVKKIDALRTKTGLIMASFGHAGDGNIHFNIMLDKKDKDQLKKAEDAVDELFDYTLKLGGTISGEHGIGITKAPYLEKEIGSVELALMKRIKQVFDPKGILNPGKIFQG